MKTISFFLAIILATIPSAAFAQGATQITILTNKQSYVAGNTISISGTISSLGASNSAVLQVYNPFNVLVQIATIPVAADGTFHGTIKAEGQSWANDGVYQIKVLYVSTPILATSSADIVFKATQPPVQSAPVTSPQSQAVTTPQPSTTTSMQNTTQVIVPDTSIPIEEQIKQRIALADKLRQQLDQNNTVKIPFWVKDTARKWHDGTIPNEEFSKDIQYFISSGLVRTSREMTPADTFDHIPSWQKEVAGWWSQGLVSDYDYVNSIQFLLDQKIIS